MTPRCSSLASRACTVPRATPSRRATSSSPTRGFSRSVAMSRASSSSIPLVNVTSDCATALLEGAQIGTCDRSHLPTAVDVLHCEAGHLPGRDTHVRRRPALLTGHARARTARSPSTSAADHPGFADEAYRRRRNEIAQLALRWQPGEPAPDVGYTEAEHDVWRTVCRELRPKHEKLAIREYVEALDAVEPPDRLRPEPRRGLASASSRSPASATSPPPASSRCASSTARCSERVFHSHAVRAPPRRAALHARAGHHPRGHRPRAPARDADLLRAAPPHRRGDPPPHRRGQPALPLARCSGSPSSSASSWRTASCKRLRRRDPLLATARSTSSATWSSAR